MVTAAHSRGVMTKRRPGPALGQGHGKDDDQQDEQGLLSFTVVKEGKRTCIKVQAVAPSEMRVDVNSRWGAEPAMIGRQFGRRRFELEQDGYDLSDVGASSPAEPDSAMLAELERDEPAVAAIAVARPAAPPEASGE